MARTSVFALRTVLLIGLGVVANSLACTSKGAGGSPTNNGEGGDGNLAGGVSALSSSGRENLAAGGSGTSALNSGSGAGGVERSSNLSASGGFSGPASTYTVASSGAARSTLTASGTGGRVGGSATANGAGTATGGAHGGAVTSGGVGATGGMRVTSSGSAVGGGSVSAGSSAGGLITTGGTSASNSASAAGAAASNARGSGICSAGSYAAPDLTAVPLLVSSSAASGQYEGALWLETQGILLFSGMDTNATGVVPATVGALTLPNTLDVNFITDSGTNGLAVDFRGNVLAGSQKVQGIVSIEVKTKTLTTLVNTDASGHHFNSVNDLTVRTDGTIYFTDPDYQLGGRSNETGVKGVYRFSPTKVVSLVDGQFNQPNGISLSPNEAVLYVSDTAANKIREFNVATDGSLSGKADFASVTSPDGGAVDCAGNLYWALNATPGKVVVLAPDGRQLGTIAVGSADKPTNVAFGGLDHKTLYVTTSPRKIYSIAMNIPGFPY